MPRSAFLLSLLLLPIIAAQIVVRNDDDDEYDYYDYYTDGGAFPDGFAYATVDDGKSKIAWE